MTMLAQEQAGLEQATRTDWLATGRRRFWRWVSRIRTRARLIAAKLNGW